MDSAALVWTQASADYDFGAQHPLRPERVLLTVDLIKAAGVLDRNNARLVEPEPASDAEIALVHDRAYIELVKGLGHGDTPGSQAASAGLGWGDNPIFPYMHEATAWIAGAAITATRLVLENEVNHTFSPSGGLHHAQRARASGFCIYDDPAIAIAYARKARPDWRILYVDVDAHHGDGVQEIFWNDPQVMTVSLHESGEYLFPGTGFIGETGGAGARGTKVNLPLPPMTTDGEYIEALKALISDLAESFRPNLLVTQLGCDTHWSDPLTHLQLTMRAYPPIYSICHQLAHDYCNGRWVATGGGGYEWLRVVPRAWTLAFAEMCAPEVGGGLELLPADIPQVWHETASKLVSHSVNHADLPKGFLQDIEPPAGDAGGVRQALADLRRELAASAESLPHLKD